MAVALLFGGCRAGENKIIDEFKEVNMDKWSWHSPVDFTFEIKEPGYYYDFYCGLRISGSYNYSNIWLIYTVDGPKLSTKEKLQIQLSDNTGKWLGKGMNNLLVYKALFARKVKLEPGKYTIKFTQNMRDEELRYVSDVGLKVVRAGKVY